MPPLVSANLAAFCVETLLYGIFIVLFVASVYLQVRRQQQHAEASDRVATAMCRFRQRMCATPMFMPGICLGITVTAHWTLTVTRLFQAFVGIDGGNQPFLFSADLGQTTNVVKTAFLFASCMIGDATSIYRTWVIWNRMLSAVIFPLCSFIGVVVGGIGITCQFGIYKFAKDVYMAEIGRWVLSHCILTSFTNIYCSCMIAYKIWSTNRSVRAYTGGRTMGALIIFVESAALYTIWSLFFFISFESRSNLQLIVINAWTPVTGITYTLIIVCVAVRLVYKAPSYSQSLDLHLSPPNNEQDTMRPVAADISQVANVEDVPALSTSQPPADISRAVFC
ncbi:hypothetical protein BKA93DRAFT_502418 [Sparassis latifolia]